MEKKGLCDTCVKDKECIFQRRFPVLECEEFDDRQPHTREEQSNTPRCKAA